MFFSGFLTINSKNETKIHIYNNNSNTKEKDCQHFDIDITKS